MNKNTASLITVLEILSGILDAVKQEDFAAENLSNEALVYDWIDAAYGPQPYKIQSRVMTALKEIL